MKLAKVPHKILLVDDEQAVLDVTTRMLETLGCKVTATSSSVNALDLFRTDPDQFDLVITDMTMPNMTGDELASKIMKIRPGMPVILYSGNGQIITEDIIKEMGIRKFVQKPANMKDLSETLSMILEVE
jgi:DNA-binding NtrC family response regulator